MSSTPHILVINGTKVRQPVFILGAPHSGTDLLARAIKRTPGFHLTMAHPGVTRVTYAFARKPGIAAEIPRPKTIDVVDPGGVNRTTLKASPTAMSRSSRNPIRV